jgi:predicted nucleic-acid-binding Zn-ribbon protein
MAKKEKKQMCGSCHGEFKTEELQMVTLHVNPGVERNGRYMRILCGQCADSDFYKNRILQSETPRKLN